MLRAVKKDNSVIVELEKKKDEFRQKYENYKKLAYKERDEKEARIRDLELLKKDRAVAKSTTEGDRKDLQPNEQNSANIPEKYENLKILYNK